MGRNVGDRRPLPTQQRADDREQHRELCADQPHELARELLVQAVETALHPRNPAGSSSRNRSIF